MVVHAAAEDWRAAVLLLQQKGADMAAAMHVLIKRGFASTLDAVLGASSEENVPDYAFYLLKKSVLFAKPNVLASLLARCRNDERLPSLMPVVVQRGSLAALRALLAAGVSALPPDDLLSLERNDWCRVMDGVADGLSAPDRRVLVARWGANMPVARALEESAECRASLVRPPRHRAA